jgi:sulfate transport system ATP-binding protein
MRPERAEGFGLAERRTGAVAVAVEGVAKAYRTGAALHGVTLTARRGEILALVGPSGSGKTTLLRLIAGLEGADAGAVRFDDEDVTGAPPSARRVGFVFQHYALFRHMSVFRNVAFGLDVKPRSERPGRAERKRIVGALLELVGLPDLADRRPAQLSGGQRQRVALARALAVSPRLLLLDEPFGALDVLVRKALRRELRRIQAATGVTTVFVTHDQEEALELADQVAVLNKGRLEQAGSPMEVLERPASAFVAGFFGQANAVRGRVSAGLFSGLGARLPADGVADGPATAFVRPEHIRLAVDGEAAVESRLLRLLPRSGGVLLECAGPEGAVLEALAPSSAAVEALGVGDLVRLVFARGHVFADPP